jgi:hypothetical protein
MYFGKTIKNPEKYNGSGSYWTKHINKHGKEHVVTLWYCLFYDEQDCKEFALSFSEKQNIVESKDWANQIYENGTDGFDNGNTNPSHIASINGTHHFYGGEISAIVSRRRVKNGTHNWQGEDAAIKSSKRQLDLVKKGIHNWQGKEHNANMVENGTHPFLGGEIQRKYNKLHVENGTHPFLKENLILLKCPYCGKEGFGGGMKTWHFENCRKKII